MVRHTGLVITRLELVLPPLRVPLKGKITLGDHFTIDAELATGTVSLSSLPEWIHKGGVEAGNFELSMDIKGSDADWKTWRIRDVNTAQDLPDTLQFTKFTQVSWDRDSSGLYYSRYPLGANGQGDPSQQVAIYRHRLGDAQAQDQLIFAVTDHPTRNPYPRVTEDGRYLLIEVFDGYATNGVYYLPLKAPGQPAAREAVRARLDRDLIGAVMCRAR